MFKKLLLTAFLLSINQIALADSHKILNNYSELLNSLKKGDEVRAIIQFKKCSSPLKDTNSPNDVIGSMNFTNFNKYKIQIDKQIKKEGIATSITMLVKTAQNKFVNNYVRLRIFEDNSAEIFSEFLDPTNYSSIKNATFSCHLSNGKDDNAIALYDLSS
jgi:hypothetical protein